MGRTIIVEMPEGFELSESQVEVHREGGLILLRPIAGDPQAKTDPHWLDQFEREPDAELRADLGSMDHAIEQMRAADRAKETVQPT